MFLLVGVYSGVSVEHSLFLKDQQLNITAEMAHPNCRVHVLTDNEDTIQRVRRLAATLPWGNRLIAKDVRPLLEGPRTAFLQKYRHQSINNRDYEAYCFWRWGVYSAYMKELADSHLILSRVFTLDADVVPTRPVVQWLPLDVDAAFGKSVTIVELTWGAVILWTPAELDTYWAFLVDLYSTQSRTETWVRRYGTVFPCVGPRESEVIACEGAKQLHVSDMAAFWAFREENLDARRALTYADELFEKKDPVEHARLLRKLDPYSCLPTKRAGAFSMSTWTLAMSGGPDIAMDHRSRAGWSIVLPNVELPPCYIHFQGRSKQSMAELCDLIKARVNGSTMFLRKAE